MSEIQANQKVAERICQAKKWNGQAFQDGQCLALLDGKVVAIAADLDEALKALRSLEPDPHRGMVVEVATPVIDVVR